MDNMNEKTIMIGEESFIIRKLSVTEAFPILQLSLVQLLPAIGEMGKAEKKTSKPGEPSALKAKGEDDGFSIPDINSLIEILLPVLSGLTEEDYNTVIKLCLTHASKVLSAGPAPVMRKDGTYGVEGFEYDAMKTFKLVFEVIKYSIGVFFPENFQSLAGLTSAMP